MSTPANKAKPRLGRGLSSLISVSDLPVDAAIPADAAPPAVDSPEVVSHDAVQPPAVSPAVHSPHEVPVAQIAPNPHQPRKDFNEVAIASLAASIRTTGLVQPIVVRRIAENQYQLIAGERRLRAAKAAGLDTIPALIRDVDPIRQAQMALIENIQREDLNPIDRAMAYRALMTQLGLTQAEMAGRLGEERSSIANYLRLLDLSEPVRNLVRTGQLSLGHAKILAGVADPVQQQELAEMVTAQDLSVRNLERVMTQTPPPASQAAPPARSAHIRDLEKTITSQLGMKVQLRAGSQKGKGKLVIHYTTLDQFDDLLGRLGVKSE